jgi:hypothetical protein
VIWFVVLFVICGALAAPANAQLVPGGFLELATSTDVRSAIMPELPSRGVFTFPLPYGTVGSRITNETDCGGQDCINYVGYSYWRNMNNHVGRNIMYILLTADRNRGGAGPTLFAFDKTQGSAGNWGPLFDPNSYWSWHSGEGWYWSATQADILYVNDYQRLYRFNVATRTFHLVADIALSGGIPGATYIKQIHTSDNDQVHTSTILDANWQPMGCVVYQESRQEFWYWPLNADYDECQIDRSGSWLLIKQQMDGLYGVDNLIVNLTTLAETAFLDRHGAAGHSDSGYGYMVAEDNWAPVPGAVRLWWFGTPQGPQGAIVYRTTSWAPLSFHISHTNAKASGSQYACGSSASRLALPRANEVVCFRLDESLQVLVVAPVMTNLDASGGGDDYAKLPKGNLDVSGEYFIWTSNTGSGRLDAFVVRVPVHLLVP